MGLLWAYAVVTNGPPHVKDVLTQCQGDNELLLCIEMLKMILVVGQTVLIKHREDRLLFPLYLAALDHAASKS